LALAGITTAPLRAQDFPAVGQASRATLALAGLKAPVGVYRDTLGIPHIYAGSAEDAYFALGYLHATDRLFEMEVFRRRASGTLAEVFGKASLDDDIFVRQIGIRRSAEAAWKSHRLDGRIRSEMEAYCAGVNARLGELQKLSGPKLPAIFGSGLKVCCCWSSIVLLCLGWWWVASGCSGTATLKKPLLES
jgi:acyl-homoserine lactone acylase PvdQ